MMNHIEQNNSNSLINISITESDINKIKERRNDKNADITIYYDRSGYGIDGEWDFDYHEDIPIKGDQLSLTNCCTYGDGTTFYEFAVHKKVKSRFFCQKHMTLVVEFSNKHEQVNATMHYETTTHQIRKGKISSFLKSTAK